MNHYSIMLSSNEWCKKIENLKQIVSHVVMHLHNLNLEYLYCRVRKTNYVHPTHKEQKSTSVFFISKISLVGQFAITVILESMEIQLCRERRKPDEVRKAIFWWISSLFHLLSIPFSKGDTLCSSPFLKWY